MFDAKRLLGTKYDSTRRKHYEQMYPWTKLSASSDGAIEAAVDSPEKLARPEELVGALAGDVRHMSLSASVFKFFGVHEVKRAVLTAPAHFSAQRRQVVSAERVELKRLRFNNSVRSHNGRLWSMRLRLAV